MDLQVELNNSEVQTHNLMVLNFHPIPFYKEVTFELKLIGMKQEKLFQYVGYVQNFFSFQLDDNI